MPAFSLTNYNYNLPKTLIAQKPADKRDHSRLLHLNRKTKNCEHLYFFDIYNLLLPNDIVIINNTRVIPGRIFGHKQKTGGKIELLVIDYASCQLQEKKDKTIICKCMIKASRPSAPGSIFIFDHGIKAVVQSLNDQFCTVKFLFKGSFEQLINSIGNIPLPPYIKQKSSDNQSINNKESYQTVYASAKGAIAAPTAGLHFSNELIEKIKSKGVKIVEITLHVGSGTFMPVRATDIRNHNMHSEMYTISKESAKTINNAKKNGCRIIAVGTTCVRTLEYASNANGFVIPGSGNCDIYIYPGYDFKVINAMITNFHLPQSTLLMLVSAFSGLDEILNIYKKAIKKKYRFYSYGDAMFID